MRLLAHALQVPVNTRIEQFPGHSFRNSVGAIMCACCLMTVPNISSSLNHHIGTAKHKNNLAEWNARNSADVDLMVALGDYFRANPNEHMATLSQNDHLYRFRVVQTFMKAGVALNKINIFRPLLSRAGSALPATT